MAFENKGIVPFLLTSGLSEKKGPCDVRCSAGVLSARIQNKKSVAANRDVGLFGCTVVDNCPMGTETGYCVERRTKIVLFKFSARYRIRQWSSE